MINVISMNTNTAGRKLFRLSVLPIALISFCQFAGASTYYVATNGNDSNPGSLSAPFQTLQRGANQAIAGDTLIVQDGTYGHVNAVTGGDSANYAATPVLLYNSGTASDWITIKAANKGKAILDCEMICDSYINLLNASYIVIQDFVITRGYKEGIHSNDAAHHITLRGNRFEYIANRTTSTNLGLDGLYTNAACHDFIIDGNVFHDIGRSNYQWLDHGLYLHGYNYTIINNVFYNNTRGWAIQMANGLSNVLIANNTFAFPGAQDGHIMMWDTQSNLTVRNNVFYNPTSYAFSRYTSSVSSCTIDHNIVYGAYGVMADSSGCSVSANQVGANPMFANASGFDFHVQSGGPGIDSGVNISSVVVDMEGKSRPQGASTDIGAYEYQAATVTPPVIFGVFTSNISANSAFVSWSTDVSATSSVDYGLSSYTNATPQDATMMTQHTVAVSNLNPSTLYHFRAASKNSTGQLGMSSDFTFTTAAPAPTVLSLSASAPTPSVVRGQQASSGITATLVSGSAVSATFSTSSLPSGVTAAFSSPSCTVTCSTTLTFSTTTSAPTGTYSIPVTATGSGTSASTTITLTIVAPTQTSTVMSLSVSTPIIWIGSGWQGSTVLITAALVSGNAVPVTFSAASLPSGVTAVFSTPSCTLSCSTYLLFSASTSAPGGTYSVPVTGVGSGTSASITLTLNILGTVPTPTPTVLSLSASAPTLSVAPGQQASSGITATLVSGSAVSATFSTSSLPSGVTAAFSSPSCTVTCNTTLTFSTTTSAPAGTYSIAVSGTGSGTSASTTITLTIVAPVPPPVTPPPTPGDITSGMAAWWNFNEPLNRNGSGPYAFDSSGNGNTATLKGAKWANGTYGSAVKLNGSAYVSVLDSASIGMTQALTVSFWLNADVSPNVDPRVISKAYNWDVKLNGSNRNPQFSAGGSYAMLNYSLPLNTWQHVVFTFSQGVVNGYVNGVPVSFAANTFSSQPLPSYAYGLLIGSDPSLTASLTGLVDEVRLYNRALSASDVSALYSATLH